MDQKMRHFLILGSGCLLASVVAVGVTAISLFARNAELADLRQVLDDETFGRIVGMTGADRLTVVVGAVLFAVGALLIIAGVLRRNTGP